MGKIDQLEVKIVRLERENESLDKTVKQLEHANDALQNELNAAQTDWQVTAIDTSADPLGTAFREIDVTMRRAGC